MKSQDFFKSPHDSAEGPCRSCRSGKNIPCLQCDGHHQRPREAGDRNSRQGSGYFYDRCPRPVDGRIVAPRVSRKKSDEIPDKLPDDIQNMKSMAIFKARKRKPSMVDHIMRMEGGEASEDEGRHAMQQMVNSGHAWKMQGSYGRAAMDMIRAGHIALGHVGHRDYYGNYVPSRHEVEEGTKGHASFVRAAGYEPDKCGKDCPSPEVPDQLPKNIRNMRKSEIKIEKAKVAKPDEGQSSPRLIIVRHGRTALNGTSDDSSSDRIRGWSDPPLTPEGRKAAQQSAKEIAGQFKVVALFSSDLSRASDTAKMVGDAVGVKPKVNQKLRPWNLGHFTGKESAKVGKEIMEYVEAPDKIVPGGEALVQFEQRLMPYFIEIANKAKTAKGDTVIVTHTRDVRAILGWIRAGEKTEVDRKYLLDKKDPIEPGGWLGLELKRGKWVDTPGDDNPLAKSQEIFKSDENVYERCSECDHARGNHDIMGGCGECLASNRRGTRRAFGDGEYNWSHEFSSKPAITGNATSPRLNPVSLGRVKVAHPNPTEVRQHNEFRQTALESLRDKYHGGKANLRTQTKVGDVMGQTSLDEMKQRFYGTARDKTEKSQRIWKGRTPPVYSMQSRQGGLTHFTGAGTNESSVVYGKRASYRNYSGASVGRMLRLRSQSSGIRGVINRRFFGGKTRVIS